jgi:predicted nucleic acid-binding Zn ribbon protein
MEPLQQTAVRVIGPLLREQPLTPGKVAFAWSIAAGPVLGRHGRTIWTGDGTLRIAPTDAAWASELSRARAVVTERLRHLLGRDTVRRIEVL